MSREQISDNVVVRILDECDMSDPDDIFIKSDEEFISQRVAFEAEDYPEVHSEKSNIVSEKKIVLEFPMKGYSLQNQEEKSLFRCPRCLASPI